LASDRKEFPGASVDLVYLDPPFNSNADYNVLFREPSAQVNQAQFHAMRAYTKSAIAVFLSAGTLAAQTSPSPTCTSSRRCPERLSRTAARSFNRSAFRRTNPVASV
jgi:hypothetical protein